MDGWGVFEIIITIVGFLGVIFGLIIPVVKVIQRNTDAINSLTTELKELATTNKQDHDNFYRDINGLKQDVAVINEKIKH